MNKLVLSIFLFFVIFSVNSQETITLSVAIKNLSTAPIQIVYSDDYLDADMLVLDGQINSINDLNIFLNSIKFELDEIKQNVYLIKPIQEIAIETSRSLIYGDVVDSLSKRTIKNAKITIDNKFSTIIKPSGYAIINLDSKKYQLSITAPSYISKSVFIDLSDNKNQFLLVQLDKAPKKLENLLVTTSLFDFYKSGNSNQKIITHSELESMPSLGNDPSRTIEKIPGLTSNGISARHHARGGKQNESQVILNGLSLRNPYHFKDFFGVFSTINLNYVEELSLFAGVFPARYGSYISSVMDVESKTPYEGFFVDTSLGIFNSHLTIGDSINNDKLNYLISYRSGGDLFRSGLLEVNTGKPSYDDLFLNISSTLDNGITINGNMLQSKDNIDLNLVNEDEIASAKYSDSNYWASMNIPLSNGLNVTSMVYHQTNKTARSGSLFDDLIQGNILEDKETKTFGLTTDFDYQLNNDSLLSLGFNIQKEDTQLKYISGYSGGDFVSDLINPQNIDLSRNHLFENSGTSSAIYTNLRHKFTDKFFGDFGLRLDNQTWIDELQLSPRINLSYHLNDTTSFRMGLGRHHQQQFIDGVLLEDENLDYFEPESANIAILEFQKKINDKYTFRSEFYYKSYGHVQPYYENLFIGLHLHPELFTDRIRIAPNSAFSKGVDLTLESSRINTDWSVSYSFSEVKDVFDNVEVLRSWDQKSSVKYSQNWYLNNWQISTLLQYHTGWPKTEIFLSDGQPLIDERNASRNKDYINFDLKVSYDQSFKSSKIKYWFQINNLFNRKNQCCSEFSFEENDSGDFVLIDEQKNWLPIIPSLGIDIYF